LSFYLTPEGLFRSTLFEALPWLDHGFGTRLGQPGGELLTLRQIHSARVCRAESHPPDPEGDALITTRPCTSIAVKTADCVPVLLALPGAVAAVHAGWRGTAANIAAEALARLLEGRPPELAYAAIGPAIGPCCYEVGPEVRTALAPWIDSAANSAHVDLVEANRRQLLAAGMAPDRIDAGRLCTRCRPDWFESFRRDGAAAGRMLSAVRLREPLEK
jgi:hypothetical protein